MPSPCQLRDKKVFGILDCFGIFTVLFHEFSLDWQLKQISKTVFNKCMCRVLKSEGRYVFADAYCWYNILDILHVLNINYHVIINLKVLMNIFALFFPFHIIEIETR